MKNIERLNLKIGSERFVHEGGEPVLTRTALLLEDPPDENGWPTPRDWAGTQFVDELNDWGRWNSDYQFQTTCRIGWSFGLDMPATEFRRRVFEGVIEWASTHGYDEREVRAVRAVFAV